MYSEKAMRRLTVGLLIILSIILIIILSGCNFDMKKKPEPNTVSQPIEIK